MNEWKWSYSRMNAFRMCERAAARKYIDGVKIEAGQAAAVGKNVHEIIFQHLKAAQAGKPVGIKAETTEAAKLYETWQ